MTTVADSSDLQQHGLYDPAHVTTPVAGFVAHIKGEKPRERPRRSRFWRT
jgi:hypothetical protein